MNEPRRPGRPKKHLADEHHFKHDETTSNDEFNAGVDIPFEPSMADKIKENIEAEKQKIEKELATNIYSNEAVVENSIVDAAPSGDSAESEFSPSLQTEDAKVAASHQIQEESPVEKKIHQLMVDSHLTASNNSVAGWHSIDTEIVLKMPPRNGMPVKLSEIPEGDGVVGYWKKTRKFANATHRWQESGKWIDWFTGMDINFTPKYWKERNAI